MIFANLLRSKLIENFQDSGGNYPVYRSFSDQTYNPSGTVAISIGKATQLNPGYNDFFVEVLFAVRSHVDYDPQYSHHTEIVNDITNKLTAYERYGVLDCPISFPGLVGILPFSVSEEFADDGKETVVLCTFAISADDELSNQTMLAAFQ